MPDITADSFVLEHRHTLATALRNEVLSARDDEKVMRRMAAALRAGETHALFAPGEDGAVACDRLAEAHAQRAAVANRAMDEMEDITYD